MDAIRFLIHAANVAARCGQMERAARLARLAETLHGGCHAPR